MGRPRAGIASTCVIIVRSYLRGVNGTDGLELTGGEEASKAGPKSPPSQTEDGAPDGKPPEKACATRLHRSPLNGAPRLAGRDASCLTCPILAPLLERAAGPDLNSDRTFCDRSSRTRRFRARRNGPRRGKVRRELEPAWKPEIDPRQDTGSGRGEWIWSTDLLVV